MFFIFCIIYILIYIVYKLKKYSTQFCNLLFSQQIYFIFYTVYFKVTLNKCDFFFFGCIYLPSYGHTIIQLTFQLYGTLRVCRQRRQWHPIPVLLPGKSHGWRRLVGCSPWVAKSRTQLSDFTLTFYFHALEKEMATHSSVLAWKIPGMGEPGGLPSMGLPQQDTTEATQQQQQQQGMQEISTYI